MRGGFSGGGVSGSQPHSDVGADRARNPPAGSEHEADPAGKGAAYEKGGNQLSTNGRNIVQSL